LRTRCLGGEYLDLRGGVAGCWRRRLHNEELRSFYASPNIIKVIKPRRMTLAGLVECVVELRNA
jgi:hypothetical protein